MPSRGAPCAVAALCLSVPLITGCGDSGTEPQSGSIYVRLAITGSLPDADGCTVSVDGGGTQLLLDGEHHLFVGLPTGTHAVAISDVAFNCSVQGEVSQSVVVSADETSTAPFIVDCPAPGSIEVVTPTAGSTTDPDGYTVVLDVMTTRSIGVSGLETFPDLAVGQHQLELIDVADNCSVIGENPRAVTVEEGVATRIDFGVACPPFYDYIAFSSSRGEGSNIFVMKPDGSDLLNLTPGTSSYGYPAWAPDATRIAFTGGRDIWVLNTATMQVTQLTHGARAQLSAWSPDGARIAYDNFDCIDCDTCGDIWVINAEGSNPVNLTPGAAGGYEPSWSPDGSQIAFVEGGLVGDVPNIWVMEADGSNPVQVTNFQQYEPVYEPAWSPDGTRIAYSGGGEQAVNTIWVMDADGSNPTHLTGDLPAYQAWRPSWSPDGSRIVYWGYRPDDGYCYQIHVMEADGSNPTNITNGNGCNTFPSWSPGQ